MLLQEALAVANDLKTMRDTQGSNAKKALAVGWNTPAHAEFLDLVGNSKRQWYITWTPQSLILPLDDGIEWGDIWCEAELRIAKPEITTRRIGDLMRRGWPPLLLKAIVDKTLDAGITVKEVLKARGIKKPFSIALAADWCDMKLEKREKVVGTRMYASTPKMDGLRCFFVLIPGEYAVLSREMKPLKNLGKHLEALKEMFKDFPCCIDGEIMAKNWNESVTATKSSSGGHIKTSLHPFDLVTAEEYKSGVFTMKKVKRLAELNKRIVYGEMFTQVPFEPVYDLKDVDRLLREHLAQGFEGSVLHDMTAVYRPRPDKADNRTLAWIKVKEWKSSEFNVVGFMAGTGKHNGRLGALVVEGNVDIVKDDVVVETRFVRSEVGTGLKDSLREEIWKNQSAWLGARVEIKWFEVTEKSLRFPSFLRRRIDQENA